jgi:hypothetical protein
MNIRQLTFACLLLLFSWQPLSASAAEGIASNAVEKTQVSGWIIAVSRREATDRYAIVVQEKWGSEHCRLIPAIMDTPIPPSSLGESCVITGVFETNAVGQSTQFRVMKIEKMKW